VPIVTVITVLPVSTVTEAEIPETATVPADTNSRPVPAVIVNEPPISPSKFSFTLM
jgi:hypothetical protein